MCFVICHMFIVQAHWFMHTYIAIELSLICYYHSLFYSLGHGAIILTYCTTVTSYTMVAPKLCFYQIIVQSDVTIVVP